MQITVNQQKLSRALSYVSRSVSSKPNIPVLSNILLEVEKGTLKLSGTNLDMGMTMWIAGEVETEGKVTVAARIFSDFISASPVGKVKLTLEGNSLEVVTDKSRAKFQTIKAEEFPILPKIEDKPLFSVNPDMFVEALEKVAFACATDAVPGKTQQTGIFFEVSQEENFITMVGLDGYRLSEKKLKIKREDTQEFSGIVPARSLQELAKVVQSEEEVEEVAFYVSPNHSQAMLKFNEIEFSTRLLEGPYPDYKKVLPSEHEYSFDLNKSDLEQSIKIMNTFARSVLGNRTDCDIDPDKGKMLMRSSVADLGQNETEVKIQNPEGEGLETAYNLRYLSDMVSVMQGDTIKYETKSALSAALFRDSDDPDFIHIIMPLKRD